MKLKGLFYFIIILGVLIVVIICGSMGYMMHRHRKGSRLFQDGEAAFLRGDYDSAEHALKAYVAYDKDKEEAWKYLAEINESRENWFEAARIWRRLVGLNVLNDDYLSRCIKANYITHNYAELGQIFDVFAEKRRENYLEIYTLTQFKLHPKDESTTELIDRLPDESNVKRLIIAMKNLGPASELAALKAVDDRIIQIEAYMLDASIAEVREKNLERAEENLRKAVEINPQMCLAELGDFLFRNKRYEEAAEAFANPKAFLLNNVTILNYAETLFYHKNVEELKNLERKIPGSDGYAIATRAYLQSLCAFLEKDTASMAKNYEVAQIHRNTPMGLVIGYAVGVEKSDIVLVTNVLRYWKPTAVFKEKREIIIENSRTLLEKAIKERKFQDGAALARLLIDVQPPELLVWHTLLYEQSSRGKISNELLKKAIELFPDDVTIRTFALRVAYAKGDNDEIVKAYEEVIAKSDKPFDERYKKALYFEQKGMNNEAFAEIKRILKEDNTLDEAKHCLAFGMRTGNKEALELAGKFPELSEIAKFEFERRYGDAKVAATLLREHTLEKGLNVEVICDREILLPLAIYLGMVGANERAVTALEALKPYTQSSPTVELNLSENYAMLGKKELAMSTIEAAYSRFTTSNVVRAVYGLRCAENKDYQKAVTLIPDSATEPRFRATLVESLEKTIEACFGENRHVTCRNYITRLLAIQPDNECAKEYLQKLDAIQAAEEAEEQEK